MAGLTLLLETQKSRVSKKSTASGTPQILRKADMLRLCRATAKRQGHNAGGDAAAATMASGFLEACNLCRRRLSPEKDIYMYRGDRGFCSVECRLRQIAMDEESVRMDKCGLVASSAVRPASASASTATAAASPAHQRKGGATKAGFAY